jgi:RsiW-degrading membrane proteinase PrsW (M82 family)
MEKINLSNLENEFTNEKLRPLKLIVIALNIGVLLFFMVAMILYFRNMKGASSSNLNTDFYNAMLLVLAVITFSTLYASKIVPDKLFGRGSTNLITAVNSYYIIKLAFIEGAVFLGLVIFLTGVLNSDVSANQAIWLTLIPMILFFFISYTNFPTRENVITMVKEKYHRMNIS